MSLEYYLSIVSWFSQVEHLANICLAFSFELAMFLQGFFEIFFFNKYHRTNVVVLLIYNSFFPGNVNIYYCWLLVTRRNSSILSTLDRLLTPYAAFCLYLLTPGIGFQLRVLCMVGKHCTIYILYPEYFVF